MTFSKLDRTSPITSGVEYTLSMLVLTLFLSLNLPSMTLIQRYFAYFFAGNLGVLTTMIAF